MHDEDDFLRKLLENPADDTVRLVYADWLDEREDKESKTKAKFLRLTVQLREPRRPAGWRKARRKQMQPLAAKLPTDWLAAVSRLQIDSCGKKAANRQVGELAEQFDFVCDRSWDQLAPTDDVAVRNCAECKENVHYCDTITQAREHARRGHCVAVDLGVIRRDDDLKQPLIVMGRPSGAWYFKQLHDRTAVDPVSEKREDDKRRQNAGGGTTPT